MPLGADQGYIQVFEYTQAFVSPNRATYRCLDPGYTQVFGFPTRATLGRLDSNQGYTQVFAVPNDNPASCHCALPRISLHAVVEALRRP